MSDDPQDLGAIDWDNLTYFQLEEGEMFWFGTSTDTKVNPAHRKINDNTALNILTQQQIEVPSNKKIWLKEW